MSSLHPVLPTNTKQNVELKSINKITFHVLHFTIRASFFFLSWHPNRLIKKTKTKQWDSHKKFRKRTCTSVKKVPFSVKSNKVLSWVISLSGLLCLWAGRSMMARNDAGVGRFLPGPTLADGVSRLRLSHVQVRLILRFLCCGGLCGAVAANTHLDDAKPEERVRSEVFGCD